MDTNSLAKNAIFNIVYKLLNVFFPLFAFIYVARILHPDGIGAVSAVQNNVSYFMILATLGVPAYGIREIARVRDKQSELDNLFSELVIINAILTIFSFLFLLSLIFLIPIFQEKKILYLIFSLTVVLNLVNFDWLFQGLEEYVFIAIRSTIIKVLSIIAIVIFVRERSDVYKYALISVIGVSGNNLLNIIHSKKKVSFSLKCLNLKRHIKALVFLTLCTISTELYARMDITMLDILQNDAQVGYYSYAHRVVNLVITFVVAVTAVFLPRLSFYYEEDRDRFNQLLKYGADLMILLSIPLFVGIVFIANPTVVLLFGEEFSPSSTILCILSPMIPLKCIGDIVCYQVMMCARRESTLMKSYFLVLVVNLANNLVLIPKMGANGAAIASVISEILAFFFVLYQSRKIVKIEPDKKNLVCTIAVSFFIAVIVFLLSKLRVSYLLMICICVFSSMVVFVFGNYLLKNHLFVDLLSKLLLQLKRLKR